MEGFKEEERRKKRASVFVFVFCFFSVVKFELIFGQFFILSVHALSSLVSLVMSTGGADFWSCVSSAKN